jgi:hypothetical protein
VIAERPGDRPGRSACPDTWTLRTVERTLERRPVSENRARPLVAAVRGDRLESPSAVDAWHSWAGRRVVLGWTPVLTVSGHGGCGPPEHAPWSERCSARPWTAVHMTASGRRWRSWTSLSGAVSAADTTVRTRGRITGVWPIAGPAAVRPDSDGGHELGRRVPPARPAGMLHRQRRSGPLLTDRC